MISIFILIILNESHADTYAHFLLIFIRQGNCRMRSSNCQRISRPDQSDSRAGAGGHMVMCPHPPSKRGSPHWGGCFEMWVHQDVPVRGPLRDLQQTSQRDEGLCGLHLLWMSPCWLLWLEASLNCLVSSQTLAHLMFCCPWLSEWPFLCRFDVFTN